MVKTRRSNKNVRKSKRQNRRSNKNVRKKQKTNSWWCQCSPGWER